MHSRWQLYLEIGGLILVLLLATSTVASSDTTEHDQILLKARVIQVDDGDSMIGSFGEMETQLVTVEVLEQPYIGETITIRNLLTDQPFYDMNVKEGNYVVVSAIETDGKVEYGLHDYYRAGSLQVLTAVFALVLLIIGGAKGLKALLSLIVMAVTVLWVLLPLILRGFNPVLVTVGISSLLALVLLLFISGVNKKTAAAMGGTIGGLVIAGLLAFLFGSSSYLTGLSSHEAQLLQIYEHTIDVRGLLFSGIIIGALGAILDVGISISSAMDQIYLENPKIEIRMLIKRGLNVGRDMLGTMANTLILAYLGSSLPLLLLFSVYETSWIKIMNLDLIATEITRSMVGSIGLACAVPLTVIFAALLQFRQRDKARIRQ